MSGNSGSSAVPSTIPHDYMTPNPDDTTAHNPDPPPRPTITLPALKDRITSTVSLFPHLKTMAARARAGITPIAAAPYADSSSAVGALAGITPIAATPAADSFSAVGALAAHPSQTDSDMTDPGDPAVLASGPFDADSFLANVAEGTPAPTSPVYPTAAPSSKRTVHRQSSRTFDTVLAPTDKPSKSKSETPKFFLDNDMVLYNHIGLAPPVAGETAIPQRERMIQNEVKLVACITSLEHAATAARNDAAARNAEFAKILADTQAALHSSEGGPSMVADVAPLRLGVEAVRADLNDAVTDFSSRLSELGPARNSSPDVLALKVERMLSRPPSSPESDPAFHALVSEVAALRSYISANTPAPTPALEDNSAFQTLYSTVGAERQRMDDIINALPPPEFYDAIASMHGDITSLAAKLVEADRNRTTLPPASASAPLPSGVAQRTALRLPLRGACRQSPPPPVAHFYRGYCSGTLMPPPPFAMPAMLSQTALAAPKCPSFPLPDLAGKRPRLDVSQNAWPDILFGPVTISAANRKALKPMAIAAIKYLVQLALSSGQHCSIGEDDVASTQIDRSNPNMLSIRFKSHEKATLFCSLVELYSPLPGQVASFRGQSGGLHNGASGAGGVSGFVTNQTLLDLFGGTRNSTSNR
ncbi:hypothetical protein B0H14DRAFT_2646239 [Mycena olivaceomarginata]|nr:hypothetical protein B0H14DRAFT_2646239 [Mycena olivaceomarginata]